MTKAAFQASFSEGSTSLEILERGTIPEPNSGCWIWLRAITSAGYGSTYWNGKSVSAHRLAWLAYHGSIPDDICVLHKCDNRACCNPDHLFLGTKKDNAIDMERKGRSYRPPTQGFVCSPPTGEKNVRAKLSDIDVIFIRKTSISIDRLAKKYSVQKKTIQKIRDRKAWRYL